MDGSDPPCAIDRRSAALAEGAPGIPLKFVYWGLGVVLVLSLVASSASTCFSSAGLNPVPTDTNTAAHDEARDDATVPSTCRLRPGFAGFVHGRERSHTSCGPRRSP